MSILYLDCAMGAAGDMLAAALLELLPDSDSFVKELNELKIPDVVYQKEASVKCGIKGTHLSVRVKGKEEDTAESDFNHGGEEEHSHSHSHGEEGSHSHSHGHEEEEEHSHSHSHGEESHSHSHNHGWEEGHSHSHGNGLYEIEHIVRGHLALSEKVKQDVMAVYELIAQAESQVHGVPIKDIHFHEVGTIDAIADIVAVCLLMERLSPQQIVVSPIHVGSGQVRCAHGILPVPAPATALLLKDIPIYGGEIKGELCTPTGAALIKHFATAFGSMPVIKIKAVGYGMGKKDFEAANCVRAILGEKIKKGKEEVLELSCNLDDMTGEEVAFAMEKLFEAGALDVYTIPIGMKKSRPGILLRVICEHLKRDAIIREIFACTTTLGIRENVLQRYTLERREEIIKNPLGEVRCKISRGYGVERKKYEYEDISRIAKEQNMSLTEVRTVFHEYENNHTNIKV